MRAEESEIGEGEGAYLDRGGEIVRGSKIPITASAFINLL